MGAIDEPLALPRHKLTTDDYHRLGEAGVLAPDARVELIDGELIDMAPIGSRHWAAVMRLDDLLKRAVGERALVAVQTSIRLGPHSEPQPDIALVRRRDDYYAEALPGPADVLLLVEVADATARLDREVKLPLYARHGIGELWIVDLQAPLLRLYRAPQGERYAQESATADPGRVEIAALPGVSVDLTGLLG